MTPGAVTPLGLLQDTALTRIRHAILVVVARAADARMLLYAVVPAKNGAIIPTTTGRPFS